jgi:hypothetical protein
MSEVTPVHAGNGDAKEADKVRGLPPDAASGAVLWAFAFKPRVDLQWLQPTESKGRSKSRSRSRSRSPRWEAT